MSGSSRATSGPALTIQPPARLLSTALTHRSHSGLRAELLEWRLADETAAHQQKLDRYQESQQAKASGGGGRAGRPPKPMDQAANVCAAQSEQERADAALQRALADPNKGNVPKGNTTDPHCRIMPAKTGGYSRACRPGGQHSTGPPKGEHRPPRPRG